MRALRAAVEAHPGAVVGAIGPGSLFCEMPPGLGIGPNRGIAGRAPLDMVVPADRVAVLSQWEALLRDGYAEVSAHLLHWRSPARLAAFDMSADYGAYVFLAWPDSADALGALGPARPRVAAPLVARVRKDTLAVLTEADVAATAMLGFGREELVGRRSIELVHPDDHPVAVDSWLHMLAEKGPARRVRLRHRCADGSWKWVEISNLNLLDDPDYGCVLTDIVDISDEMAAWEAVRAREQLLDQLAQALPVGVLQVDQGGQVVYSNERLTEVLGDLPACVADVVSMAVGPGRRVLRHALNDVLLGRVDRNVQVLITKPGTPANECLCEVNIRPLTGPDGRTSGAIACFADITEGMRLRRELEHRAATDDLTGCANRRAVMAALDEALAGAGRSGGGTATVFVDLDGFKWVNDSVGHAAGDAVLAVVGERLMGAVRSVDRVGRIGGDEFLVVCPGIASLAETAVLAERLARALAGQVTVTGRQVDLRASVGAAWAPGGGVGAEELVRSADVAMYRSKADGGRPVAVAVAAPAHAMSALPPEGLPAEQPRATAAEPGNTAGPSTPPRWRGVPALPRAQDDQTVS